MTTFAEFETKFLGSLQQERSDLQGMQGASEAQLSAWIEHLFREYLGYVWRDFTRGEGTPIGSKGGKQLFPDLRIDILSNGLIFIECKRLGRLDGPKRQEELNDGVSQLRSYIRAHLDHLDPAIAKPKTVLGVVSDGNRWFLMGLNKGNEFHTIAEWAFLTDDPRLIAQRMWLLAKPALAQPTSALVEFLARRTLAAVLKERASWLTRKLNEKLPDGSVSEELVGKWLRDAFADPVLPPQLVAAGSSVPSVPASLQPAQQSGATAVSTEAEPEEDHSAAGSTQERAERYLIRKRFWQGLLARAAGRTSLHANISAGEHNWIGTSSGIRGLNFNYTLRKSEGAAELYIDRGGSAENKSIFDQLHGQRVAIEHGFGAALSWQRLDSARACRICYTSPLGGWRTDESQWPSVQDAMIDAMVRLEKALGPYLAKLKTDSAS